MPKGVACVKFRARSLYQPRHMATRAAARACHLAAEGNLAALRALPLAALRELDAYGSQAVHWAASCGQLETLAWLVETAGEDPESVGLTTARAKKRRPLHWAARNGRLACVQYLVESARVDPDPRDRQSVSPFQLAVWQNEFAVAKYLVEEAGVDVTQLNSFDCGAQHWLGTAPRERAGVDGEALLPLAVWLKEKGCDMHAAQRQGHRPLHKAAWGGQMALCKWLRDSCAAVDDSQDHGGNYAADVAEMGGHGKLAEWLRAECSGARARSLALLGLPAETTDPSIIRAAFMSLARSCHPDRLQRLEATGGMVEAVEAVSAEGGCCSAARAAAAAGSAAVDFETIRAAYEHLTIGGGRGNQSNPTHSLHKMLRATSSSSGTGGITMGNGATASSASAAASSSSDGLNGGDGSGGGGGDASEAALCFRAQLAAVAHEYGTTGIPLPSLRKKFLEVWGKQVPTPSALGLPPKTSLRRLVEHFGDAVRVVDGDEPAAPPRSVALLSRATVLGEEEERGGEAADAAADASADDEVDLSDGPPSPTQQPQPPDGGGNTRMAAAAGHPLNSPSSLHHYVLWMGRRPSI